MSKFVGYIILTISILLTPQSVVCQTNINMEKFTTSNAPVDDKETANILKIGADVTLPKGKTVPNIIVFGGNAFVEGIVTQNVLVIFGDVQLNGEAQILGSATAVLGTVNMQSTTQIVGAKNELNIAQVIDGIIGLTSGMPRSMWGKWTWICWRISIFIILLLIQVILVSRLPVNIENMTIAMYKRPFGSVLLGILATIVMIPLVFFLFFSLIGIPLLLILWACFFFACLYGKTVISLFIGNIIFQRNRPSILAVFVGYSMYEIATFIPYFYIGKAIFLIANVISVGVCLRTAYGAKSVAPIREATSDNT